MLDLETTPDLVERLAKRLRRLTHDLVALAGEEDVPVCPELADRIGHLVLDVEHMEAVIEVLATRIQFPR